MTDKPTHGCYLDIDQDGEGAVYDDCVVETSTPEDCVVAEKENFQHKEDCPHWKARVPVRRSKIMKLNAEVTHLTELAERTDLEKAAPWLWQQYSVGCVHRDRSNCNISDSGDLCCRSDICPVVKDPNKR